MFGAYLFLAFAPLIILIQTRKKENAKNRLFVAFMMEFIVTALFFAMILS